jgi:NAD(P)-dependent dehydrogenase (short-subunit alcohol dehydrogenase family)
MSKIFITGHTSGIGKSMYDFFRNSHNVVGMSRSNGFDISDPHSIVNQLEYDCVFINNAYAPNIAQSKLLETIISKFNPGALRIINIGSVSAHRTDADTLARITYATDKEHLLQTHEHMVRLGHLSTYIELGMVDTDYNKTKPGNKLTPDQVTDLVNKIVSLPEVRNIKLIP